MKQLRYSWLLLIFFLSASYAARAPIVEPHQRLVILPSSMRVYGDAYSSLCIDLFRGSPEGEETYGIIGDNWSPKFAPDYYSSFPSDAQGINTQGLTYVGESNEPIPAYYKHFLEKIVAKYNTGGPLTSSQLDNLQDEVWVYDGLRHTGYIHPAAGSPLEDLKGAREKFTFDFNLNSNDDELIQGKASDIHYLQNSRVYVPPRNIEFTESTILCDVGAAKRSIPVHYDGVSFAEVKAVGEKDIQNGVTKYCQTFYLPPDEADIGLYKNNRHQFLLTLKASLNGSERYEMNFRIPNNNGTFRRTRASGEGLSANPSSKYDICLSDLPSRGK